MPDVGLKTRATIKDVARVADVHFTTVSLALRGHPSIPERTRARIRAAAEQIGYQREAVFSALTHFRVHGRVRADPPRLGYLINHSLDKGALVYRHHKSFFEGAKKQAALLGYELELLAMGEDYFDSRSLEKHLSARNITGIVIASFEPGFAGLSLDWDRYAVVKINSQHMAPEATQVSHDQLYEVRLAFQRMTALGYRRIGLAIGRADEESTNHRHAAGFYIEQASIPADDRVPVLLFPYNSRMSAVCEMMGRWIRAHRIDAVLCNWSVTDEMIRRNGLRVPEDVACACLCLLDDSPQLAGICPNLHMVGIKAITLLTAQLKSGELGVPEFASTTYVRSDWKDGLSAPRRN